MNERLRVAVVGAGMMGADHIHRLRTRISGVEVVAVVDADTARAQSAATSAGARTASSIEEAADGGGVDAVLIATPGQFHEQVLIPALERELAIFCEKPLTLDTDSSIRVLELEQKHRTKPCIQVGFMRRFDADYLRLKAVIDGGELGRLLMLHCRHRNPSSHIVDSEELLIRDSVVHELDIVRWLTNEPVAAIQVHKPRSSALAGGLRDPQFVLVETADGILADVEIYVNAQYGYEVSTEAVFEKGIVAIGQPDGMTIRSNGSSTTAVTSGFIERFADAYDHQIQRWVDAARIGSIDGPSAWDGYLAVVASEAGISAQKSGFRTTVSYREQPAFYSARP